MNNNKVIRVLVLFLFTQFFIQYVSAQDYSGFEIAKKYQQDHNYLLAYKYLIIFKTTNISQFNKPENLASLKLLDLQISKLEDALSQNINWYQLKTAHGWSDKTTQDSLKYTIKEIKFEKIIIN